MRLFLFFLLIPGWIFSQNADCFTIVAGKDISETGHVMTAHNEDDFGDLIVNLYRVPKNFFKKADSVWIHNDPWFTSSSYGLIWMQTTKQKLGDVFINERGISIFSNQCLSKEDTARGKLTSELRRIVAEYAESARQGVKILGHLVEKFGYASSGRTYTISDNNEAYLVAVVQGKHWVARRVPDDQVAIIPNYYTIDTINWNDTINYLYAKDLKSYAIRRGWYHPETDGPFSFKKAYADPRTLQASWNIPRHWAALRFLAPDAYYPDDISFPFAITPDSIVTRKELEKILGDHFEKSELAYPNYYPSPHGKKPLSICNAGTKFGLITAFVTKFPNHPDNIIWFAPFKACTHPFVPVSLAIRRFPKQYQSYPLKKALANQPNKNLNTFENNPRHAFTVFRNHLEFVDANYPGRHQKAVNQILTFNKTIRKIRHKKNAAEGSFIILKKLYKFYHKINRKIDKSSKKML